MGDVRERVPERTKGGYIRDRLERDDPQFRYFHLTGRADASTKKKRFGGTTNENSLGLSAGHLRAFVHVPIQETEEPLEERTEA